MSTCRLIIQDEVNIKLEGLDVDTRRKIANKLKFEVPYAKYMPQYKLGRWDGKVAFFGIGGTGYVNHLDVVVAELQKNNVEIVDIVDERQKVNLEFTPVTERYWADQGVVWPKDHPVAGTEIILRDYQVEAINNFLANPQSLQQIATGAGKTITTATLSHISEPYGRSLVIVPNKSLVEQTEEDYINCGLDVGVYFGDRKMLGCTHTICTWQSLNILDKKTKDGSAVLSLAEFLDGVSTVIIDEVHQAKAEVLKKLLTQNLRNAPIRWGLTGTIPKEKFEFESIHASIGPVVGNISAKELQDKGVLAQCHVNVVQLVDIVGHSDYQSELKYLVSDKNRLDYIGKLLNTVSQSGNTLILVDRISAGQQLAELIPNSTFISGSVKVKDRKETYDTIREGTNEVIIATYGVAAVGLNIPRIFNLVLLEPGKSFVRVIQSIGRGVRKAKDKDFVQIWDLTSTCKYAKRHLTQRKKFYKEAEYPFTIEKVEWN
ncbi:MAG: DEAD/DEAH box helicase family protein [Methylophagaceae bacterium]|jgi:superfamily II DNA or RNA helicase|tara:strand:- start:217 stop:1680 length:1464 start_codon:yes stop_codon:yes gene_type:complete